MNKLCVFCISASLFVHITAMGIIAGEGLVKQWIPVIKKPESTEVALQFVETPDNVEELKQEKPKKKKRMISDKSVEAKDMDKKTPVKKKATKARKTSESKQMAKYSDGALQPPVPKSKPKIQRDYHQFVKPEIPVEEEEKKLQEKKKEKHISASTKGSQGRDIISIPEVGEDLFSSEQKERITFEAHYHKLGPYFKKVKAKIEYYWLRYLVFKYPNTAPEESKTVVSFKILPTGDVSEIEVVEHEGDVIFRDFCVATISNTAPYPPLPDDIEELEEEGGLGVVFTFRYQ